MAPVELMPFPIGELQPRPAAEEPQG